MISVIDVAPRRAEPGASRTKISYAVLSVTVPLAFSQARSLLCLYPF